jgi:hypothetical protein
MIENPSPIPDQSRERCHIERLARATPGGRQLAGRVAGSSEETAALFDSGYRPQTEWGEDPRADRP